MGAIFCNSKRFVLSGLLLLIINNIITKLVERKHLIIFIHTGFFQNDLNRRGVEIHNTSQQEGFYVINPDILIKRFLK